MQKLNTSKNDGFKFISQQLHDIKCIKNVKCCGRFSSQRFVGVKTFLVHLGKIVNDVVHLAG